MPAAIPSQPKVENVLRAMIACGVQPGVVRVGADGSFSVEAAGAIAPAAANVAEADGLRDDEPPSWEDVQEWRSTESIPGYAQSSRQQERLAGVFAFGVKKRRRSVFRLG